jgi:surface antigen
MRALRPLLVMMALLVALVGATLSPATAAGDDYPWKYDTTNTADRWGFTKRQCVSFVAWRMAQRNHPLSNATQKWGSALTWDDTARRLGYGIGTKAVPGSIAHWNAFERSGYYASGSTIVNGVLTAGGYGHVGYVQGVYSDGSASVAQYNLNGTRRYSVTRVKAPRYLYVSVATPR